MQSPRLSLSRITAASQPAAAALSLSISLSVSFLFCFFFVSFFLFFFFPITPWPGPAPFFSLAAVIFLFLSLCFSVVSVARAQLVISNSASALLRSAGLSARLRLPSDSHSSSLHQLHSVHHPRRRRRDSVRGLAAVGPDRTRQRARRALSAPSTVANVGPPHSSHKTQALVCNTTLVNSKQFATLTLIRVGAGQH